MKRPAKRAGGKENPPALSESPPGSFAAANGYVVSGSGKDRTVKCGLCGDTARVSIVTHLKRKHPDTWEKYVDEFVTLRQRGFDYRKIMWRFDRLFSWTVIARSLTERRAGAVQVRKRRGRMALQPEKFSRMTTTSWSFPSRGTWAVHDSGYRGNWPPQVPRNLIERYSKRGDLVLDPFAGGGTTAIEAMLLGRRSIGVDLNPEAVKYADRKLKRLTRWIRREGRRPAPSAKLMRGDACKLDRIETGSVDLICAHPPYLDIITYTHDPADLSAISDLDRFRVRLRSAFLEFHRVLKDGAYCCVQIADVRRNSRLSPLGFEALRLLMGAFDLKEIIVKDQPKTAMGYFWDRRPERARFLRIAHEYIFVVQKNDGFRPRVS
jgi:DNA modification methylase